MDFKNLSRGVWDRHDCISSVLRKTQQGSDKFARRYGVSLCFVGGFFCLLSSHPLLKRPRLINLRRQLAHCNYHSGRCACCESLFQITEAC